jgi:GntR family transcriptional regulator, transcriptional repressor for pyruvate dehydrogenase complex
METESNHLRPLISADGVSIGPLRATDNAEYYLKMLIFSGQLAPGDRLPPERELSKQLGISTVTLRAAIRSLETAGFVVITRGSTGGTQVVDAASLTQRWNEWVRQGPKDYLRQMLEFRALVNVEIASLAAQRRTNADLKAMEAIVRTFDGSTRTAMRWHAAFHHALAKAAHNVYLERALSTIMGELFIPWEQAVQEQSLLEMQGFHERVLAAVKDRDSERAAREMHAHDEFTARPHKLTRKAR